MSTINPIISNSDSAYADSSVPYSDGTTSLSLSFNDNINSKTQNVSAGEPGYIGAGFTITATGIDDNGYSIYAQAADGYSNNLVGQADNSNTISPLDNATVGNSIPANYWGVAIKENSLTEEELKNITYSGLSANGTSTTAIYSNTQPATNKQFTLATAANIGSDKPADHYKTTVLLSVAAGAKEVASIPDSFAGYTTFQEVTKVVCETIPIGTEGRLKDTRDGNWYWVGRIKNAVDNNALCWMTQNLDYTGYGVAATSFTNNNYDTAQYYNPGAYAPIKNNVDLTRCNTGGVISVCNEWMAQEDILSVLDNGTPTYEPGFINASSYPSSDGRETCAKRVGALIGNPLQYVYCNVYYHTYPAMYGHYLIGKFYNWTAATKTSAIINAEASSSICPGGWKLPLSGDTYNGVDGSLYKLTNGLTYAQLSSAPYYFLRSGNYSNSTMQSVGIETTYWPATTNYAPSGVTVSSGVTSAYLGIYSTSTLQPSFSGASTYAANSVRCVAR